MNKEPLKNKRYFVNQLDKHKEYGYRHQVYFEEDIKSAVEFLKEEIERLGFKVYKEPLGVKTIKIAIDKSFPDIVKEAKK